MCRALHDVPNVPDILRDECTRHAHAQSISAHGAVLLQHSMVLHTHACDSRCACCCAIELLLSKEQQTLLIKAHRCFMRVMRLLSCCTLCLFEACLRTGRWLSCFGRRAKSREAQILERLKVLDDIVSDSGKHSMGCEAVEQA